MKNIKMESPDTELANAYRLRDFAQAVLIKDVLINHGINATIGGKNRGGSTDALKVDIIERESEVDKTIALLNIQFPEAVYRLKSIF